MFTWNKRKPEVSKKHSFPKRREILQTLMCTAFIKCVNNIICGLYNLGVGEVRDAEMGVLPERLAGRLPDTSQGDRNFEEFPRAHIPLRRLRDLILTDV